MLWSRKSFFSKFFPHFFTPDVQKMSNHIRQQMNSSTELDLADINTEETSLKNIDPNLDATIKKIKILTVNESYIPSLRALG